MPKQIIYGSKAKQKLKKGVDALANAVATTLGAKGRNVTMARNYGYPIVTHDGVTVAKEIELKDPFENIGAQMLSEAASKTNDLAGDGTTTATVLAQAMVSEGLRAVEFGVNPMGIRNGMEKATKVVIEYLKKNRIEISKKEDMVRVASISSQDTELGEFVAGVVNTVGKNGVITIEESKTSETYAEEKTGMNIDKGFISPYFITNVEKQEAVIDNPYILITDKKISATNEIVSILNGLFDKVKDSKSIVIIGDDIEGEALATLILNKMKGVLNATAIKAPSVGERKREILIDLATVTGGNLISEDAGHTFEGIALEDFGRASKVICTKDETIIVDGWGKQEDIDKRIEALNNQIEKSKSDFEKELLQSRLAKLTGGIAVIYVGAATETELKEKKYRVEDAVNATKAAVDEGVVIGGGVALLKASLELNRYIKTLKGNDEVVGAGIILRSLEAPFRKILTNAGVEPGDWLKKIKLNKGNLGFDVKQMKSADLVEIGVIDPVKVTISAIKNACSVAINILTTEAIIAPEENKKPVNAQ